MIGVDLGGRRIIKKKRRDKDSTIKFTVDVDKAGLYSLDFVYANGAVDFFFQAEDGIRALSR